MLRKKLPNCAPGPAISGTLIKSASLYINTGLAMGRQPGPYSISLSALKYSRRILAMDVIEISAGHTASHSA